MKRFRQSVALSAALLLAAPVLAQDATDPQELPPEEMPVEDMPVEDMPGEAPDEIPMDPAPADPIMDPAPAEPLPGEVDPVAPDVGDPLDADVAPAPEAGLAPAAGFVVPEGYAPLTDLAGLTADQLMGTDVRDPEGWSIGSVSDVSFGSDSAIDGVILDVGGFLGIGTHTVKLNLDELALYRDADGRLLAGSSMTKDMLQALPAYEPA